ncbi:hypothetical protein P175DRAFT_0536263 [Aspergillus ochraceoroseus IBT 24754]|uniref:Protein kinase domain-containing protein n=1 Tax=Aspergillus ochraceoroseus IBT 24754 TaxID=1392256 RepID=A0A2T5LLA0_9EURO|nr:uncharacterized protein P175DRAFT_0536263 [Aspergillus ochraceoroseus IBT 24754]PTU17060.1 hypothetical protein P175DRAFT_0536263 [Aspergillus ochraceoroseus IBT 24754]
MWIYMSENTLQILKVELVPSGCTSKDFEKGGHLENRLSRLILDGPNVKGPHVDVVASENPIQAASTFLMHASSRGSQERCEALVFEDGKAGVRGVVASDSTTFPASHSECRHHLRWLEPFERGENPEQLPKTQKRFAGHITDDLKFTYVGKDAQGAVFRFHWEEKDLCMKVFKSAEIPGPYRPIDKAMVTPFVSECRAFARLCDLHKNGKWAVKCHGWLELDEPLKKRILEPRGLKVDDFGRRVIVKDFIKDEGLRSEDFELIMSNFEIAKSAMILPHDTEKRNYRKSFLLDWGSSVTFPIPTAFGTNRSFEMYYEDLSKHGLGWMHSDWELSSRALVWPKADFNSLVQLIFTWSHMDHHQLSL